jgi:uncharacterized YccA/Bax inhibitor family protein
VLNIKPSHMALSIPLAILGYLVGSYFSGSLTGLTGALKQYAIGYYIYFFLVGIPALGLCYLENKFIYSRFMALATNFDIWGLSLGLAVSLVLVY